MEATYIRGDDGIPVLVDSSYSPSTSNGSKPEKNDNKDDIYTKKEKESKAPRRPSHEEVLKAVFTIDGEGFDVILSERNGRISWSTMSALGPRSKSSRRLSGILQSRHSSIIENKAVDGIDISTLFGARVKRQQKKGNEKEEEGQCLGVILSTIEKKNHNTLREKTAFLEHPSNELCSSWVSKIKECIRSTHQRPALIKLFLQPYAGSKKGRVIYTKTVLPLLQSAGVSVDLSEIKHNEYVKQEMAHLNLEDYDCIVCMGGDGTVYQVMDALMNRAQKEKDIEMKSGTNPVRSPVPLGIIPIGKTNNIAQSAMGVADEVTATLHIIHGNTQPVDVCAIYAADKFYHWAFNSQYGFAGQVLSLLGKYKALGTKKLDAAAVKALTKTKLRAYECDIEYIPADVPDASQNTPCRTGCTVCWDEAVLKDVQEEPTSDLVQEINPLDQSFTSSTSSIIELPQDNPWRSLKGIYMNVGLFCISGMSDYAPQGFSRFTHLNNGIMDLMLVKEVERKEFVRHLRRFGNSKDPYDFPFIEMHRVKEVRFRPRYPKGWNYNDHDYNEIKYQMTREESQLQGKKNVKVVDDLGNSTKSQSIATLDLSDNSDSDEHEDTKTKEEKAPERLVGPMYRKTFSEIEMEKQKQHVRRKEEKLKVKEEAKMVSVWNIDNQLVKQLELDFKIYHGLLRICGLGVSANTEYEDVRLGCLSGM